MKAFRMGRELGVPDHKMRPAVYLAFADMLLGMIPVVGTLIDIFCSRAAVLRKSSMNMCAASMVWIVICIWSDRLCTRL